MGVVFVAVATFLVAWPVAAAGVDSFGYERFLRETAQALAEKGSASAIGARCQCWWRFFRGTI